MLPSVPLLQVGAGGVNVHVPDEDVNAPKEQFGAADALHVNIVEPLNLPIEVPLGQVGAGGVTVHVPEEAVNVPVEQLGLALHVNTVAPLTWPKEVPLGQVGAGGVTAHVPEEAVNVPLEQVGAAVALQVKMLAPLNLFRFVPEGQVRVPPAVQLSAVLL
ncbi:hypothetical protein [Stenotrophobium rhamnosiphilum]|uniref:hypothetical protein n=1 Tax=Stenotrophobium rhamnosiphilum TaxID=2029166 RepID=UPI001374A88B|nr:hypothetical protein [Stenotrophobium rhamnosiphilum]